MRYFFSQKHEVYYQTEVEADTEQEARKLVMSDGYCDWDMCENTLVEAGDLELDEVR